MDEQRAPGAPEPQDRFVGRTIPDPGFADDSGAADPALRAVLAAYDAGRADHGAALAALLEARLLVPVVAILGEVEIDDAGLAHDKSSDMATVLVTGRDGRQALLAFTGHDSLARWRADARPVPVATELAARSAIQDGAAALVVDIAGPSRFVVAGEDLEAAARGWRLGRVADGYAWIGAPAE
ncbi:SseB family protein [Nocardioides sp. ChNu-153]|uniref:SseB family protein n=1 Tax=unclassified Nocardioides TaxID=2615069 RepID=UPI00240673AB|nr:MULTISPECIES: SseB family protein [unclassified Nocardioides]MDF9717221.1 SseB family protein [Nocardioides sp. ChNu-99]MDN7122983.1 SseB family protein [Nocardioides sp. ChNu-153]